MTSAKADNLLVSVIIPTRNRREMLKQAIRSVLDQTWQAVEVIIIDEASTDGTFEEIERLYPIFKLIRNPEAQGPSAARNCGVKISRGDFILFLDDDDLLHPNHVLDLVKATRSVPREYVISSRWRRFEVVGKEIRLGPIIRYPRERDTRTAIMELLYPTNEYRICGPSVLWPRPLFEHVMWDENLFTNGDVDFYGRSMLAGYQICGRDIGMAYYRTHAGERVAGKLSERALGSATRYRLKWSKLLASRADRESFDRAMQYGLMLLLIAWSQRKRDSEHLHELKKAYRDWGGQHYYLPFPPRNALKRLASKLALRIGGLRALALLTGLGAGIGSKARRPENWIATSNTDPDVQVISSACKAT